MADSELECKRRAVYRETDPFYESARPAAADPLATTIGDNTVDRKPEAMLALITALGFLAFFF